MPPYGGRTAVVLLLLLLLLLLLQVGLLLGHWRSLPEVANHGRIPSTLFEFKPSMARI